jgi:hypothetical protein
VADLAIVDTKGATMPPHTTLLVIGMLVTTTINVMRTTATAMLLLLVMAHVRRMKGLTTPAISSIKTWTL